MMLIHQVMMDDFVSFIRQTFSIDVVVHLEPKNDEIGRFLIGETFMCIRKTGANPIAIVHSGIEFYEIVCADTEKLNHVNNLWVGLLRLKAMKENENVEKPDANN